MVNEAGVCQGERKIPGAMLRTCLGKNICLTLPDTSWFVLR